MSNIKRIAVFTSGGDAPGMNAAIRAIVRTATYYNLHVFGIKGGYRGMINGDFIRLENRAVRNIIHRGGTMLKTARSNEFMIKEGRMKAHESLLAHDIDGCIAIGGNGTYTGANVFVEEFGLPFIGVPGTIDNDIYGTDYSIGFDTSVNTAIYAVDRIRDTADSHDRLFFVEVMGRHSGHIALYTGIGSGAGTVLLPEKASSIDSIIDILKKGKKRKRLFSIIIVAEGSKLGNAQTVADMVSEKFDGYESKVTIIGHLQRGGSPTALDRVLATRLGTHSVEGLINGERGVGVGIMNNKIVFTPLKDAIEKTNPIDEDLLRMTQIVSM